MEETATEKKEFPCSQCGAKLTFKPGTDKIVCAYCGHEQVVVIPASSGATGGSATATTQVVEHDFNEAVKNVRSVKASDVVTGGKEIQCSGCGANSIMTAQSDRCAFCGSPMVAEVKGQDAMFVPESVLPFHVDKPQAKQKYIDWIKGLWFAPNDLSKRANASGMDGIYLPYWTYDANTFTRYTGQRGEYYYVTESYKDNQGQTQTREVRHTRWYPVSGSVKVDFDDVLVCASKSLPHEMIDELEPWDLHELKPYDARYLSGFVTERYKIGLEEGFSISKQKMEDPIRSHIRGDIGGDDQQVTTMNTTYSEVKFKHLLLPLWISSYRYNEKIYRFIINARTGEVTGDRPWSWIKITLATLAGLALAGAIYYYTQLAGK